MEWLKKNMSLALGIGLPVLLVVFFALASGLPRLFVEPPKYELLYLTNYTEYVSNNLRYEVKDRQLSFYHVGKNHGNWPKLYRYSPVTGAVREITIPVPDSLPVQPSGSGVGIVSPEDFQSPTLSRIMVPVPEVEKLTIDTSSVAPDGYEFRANSGHSSGLMGGIFFSSRSRYEPVISKNGYNVRISGSADNQYYFYNTKFLGWIIP